ncbi:hypothetical protein [Streptosporangium sp. NPDC006930]|uniref:hypothetical protein n=1 Tax=unclassified Streptosporangium TaxID=2632669 RepID=UPI00341911E6
MFAWTAAVWTVSLRTYITRGAFADGADHLTLTFSSIVTAVLPAVSAGTRTRAREAMDLQ